LAAPEFSPVCWEIFQNFQPESAKISQFDPKILKWAYILLCEELKDKVYTLLLGFGGRLIDWNGLEVKLLRFYPFWPPRRGLRAGRKKVSTWGRKNIFSTKMFSPKIILNWFLGHKKKIVFKAKYFFRQKFSQVCRKFGPLGAQRPKMAQKVQNHVFIISWAM